MAEFITRQSVVVKSGDPVVLPELRMPAESKYWIECNWIKNGDEESGYGFWEIKNDSMEGAYKIWRKEHWEQLFDPFKIKILRLTINRIE